MIKENIKSDLINLVSDNLENMRYSQENHGGVYLARINMLETDGVISLEVELDEGSIAFTYPVGLEESEECFEFLKDKMEEQGIRVFVAYSEFEAALNGEEV